MTAHPLAEVRELQERDPDWLGACKEAILQVLDRRPEVHADDLEELGVPDAHANCIGSAFSALRARGWIVSTGERRASTVRRRRARKSDVYRFTKLGRANRASGLGAGSQRDHGVDRPRNPMPSVESGGQSAPAGAPFSQESDRQQASSPNPPVPSASGSSGSSPAAECTSHGSVVGDAARPTQGARDRQVRSAGCDESLESADADIPGAEGQQARRNTQPARLFELPPERPRSAWTDQEAA